MACDSTTPVVVEDRGDSPSHGLVYTSAIFDYDVAYSAWLYVYVPDDDTVIALRQDSTWNDVLDPKWSPDGRQILYTYGHVGQASLWIVDIRTRQHTMLHDDGCYSKSADWSPDSQRVAFVSICTENTSPPTATLVIVDAKLPHSSRSIPNIIEPEAASWSPTDGRLLVVGRVFDGDRGGRGLWLLEPDGTPITRIASTNDPVLEMSWSPDGSRLALSTYDAGRGTLSVIDADGSRRKVIADTQGLNRWPAWSPDGSRICYMSTRNGRTSTLYVADIASGYSRGYQRSPIRGTCSWTPDGMHVTYATSWTVDEVDIETGAARTVMTEGMSAIYADPRWSPGPWSHD